MSNGFEIGLVKYADGSLNLVFEDCCYNVGDKRFRLDPNGTAWKHVYATPDDEDGYWVEVDLVLALRVLCTELYAHA